MRLTRVYETVLYASDVAEATSFYADTLGLRLLEEPDELGSSFRLGGGGVLLLFKPELSSAAGRRVPSHGATGAGHVAFSLEPGAYDQALAELRERQVEIETEIAWEQGGRSIYFRDPAGNSVELVEGDLWPP
ncbi:MAG: VOC family protein [Actinomycetota bacterium]|nr:VOC family protein [Actinomycetota bacterium]